LFFFERELLMKSRTFRFTMLLVGCLVISGARGAAAETITPEMRRDDPRLDRPVSVSGNSLYTAELVKSLAEASGISLSTGTRDGSGDVVVSAVLREVPLGDVMDALWSLVSYRGARWHWIRRGEGSDYSYVLTRPRAAQLLPDRLRLEMQMEFERHAESMLNLLDVPPDQLQHLARQDRLAANLNTSRHSRGGLTSFRDTLSPEQRRAVLRGGERVQVPLENAPPHVRQFANGEWEFSYLNLPPRTDGRVFPTPPMPERITFYRRDHPGHLAPMLMINAGGFGAYAYLGGRPLEEQLRGSLYNEWLQPGDLPADSKPGRAVGKEREPEEVLPGDDAWTPPTAERLRRLAESAPLCFLARLDLSERGSPTPDNAETVQVFLHTLGARNPYYQSKWRGEVLLVTTPSWFGPLRGTVDVPYELVSELREAEQANDGFLPFKQIAGTLGRLSDQQLLAIGQEFPSLRLGAYWRSVFALYDSSSRAASQMRSSRGLPIHLARDALAAAADPSFAPALFDERVAGLRLREERGDSDRVIYFELVDRRGGVVRSHGVRQARKAPAKEAAAGQQ
jgi:hypothetical protein